MFLFCLLCFYFWLRSVRAVLAVLALLVLGSLVIQATEVRAVGDMNWLVPGLRVWYRGTYASPGNGQGGPSAVSTERVLTIKELGPDGATVHVLVSSEYYSQVLSDRDEVVPRPYEEGQFWINPERLAGLRPGDVIVWVGDEYQVSDRRVYGLDDLVNKYLLDTTPALVALFTSSGGQRDIVALTGTIQGQAVYTFVFDVQTGLLIATLGRDAYQESTSLSVETLAEINYDFLSRSVFPEPEGPHSDYTMEFYYMEPFSDVMIDLRVNVIGRYSDIIMFAMTVMVSGGGSVPYASVALIWSGNNTVYGKLLPAETGMPTVNIGLTDKTTVIGDHLPFYIGDDLSADRITVWNVTMINNGGTFVAQASAPFYFRSITFDSEGYATQVTLYISEIGTPAQLTTNNPGFQAQRQIYAERLGPAIPQPPPITATTTTTATPPVTAATATTATTTTTPPTMTTTTTATTTTSSAGEVTTQPPTGAIQVPSAIIGAVAGAAVGAVVVALLMRKRY